MKAQFIFETEPIEADSKAAGLGDSGRWFRRGRNIVLLLHDTARLGNSESYEAPPGDLQFPRDVIDPRIDVDAQRALISMASSRDLATINHAFDVLDLVKTGRLGGIYKEDQKVPALLARKLGQGWWQLLRRPRFGDFRLLCDRENPQAPPVVVFRRNLDRQRLIFVLREVARGKQDLQEDPPLCARP